MVTPWPSQSHVGAHKWPLFPFLFFEFIFLWPHGRSIHTTRRDSWHQYSKNPRVFFDFFCLLSNVALPPPPSFPILLYSVGSLITVELFFFLLSSVSLGQRTKMVLAHFASPLTNPKKKEKSKKQFRYFMGLRERKKKKWFLFSSLFVCCSHSTLERGNSRGSRDCP